MFNPTEILYFDNNATTPIDKRVMDAMLPFLKESFANPSSTHHFGINVNDAVKKARAQVAKLIGAEDNEILFTSGATEAINIAIKGIAENYSGKGKHIITVSTEHNAMLGACKYFKTISYEISYCLASKEDQVNSFNFKMLYQ
jgi:cysteine desulfurase